MLKFHLEQKAKVTIALTPVENPTAYGLIETDVGGRVTRFLEKPTWDQVTTNMINAGTYILEPEVLNEIPAQTNYSFERQLFPGLLARGEPVYAYPSTGYWIDIGTPDKYLQLHRDLLTGKIIGYEHAPDRYSGIDPPSEIEGPVLIGARCVIGRNAKIIGPVVIGPETTVSDGAIIQESILWQNVNIGPGVNLNNCLVANDSVFETGSSAEKSIIGDHTTITRNTKLGPGSRIWPAAK